MFDEDHAFTRTSCEFGRMVAEYSNDVIAFDPRLNGELGVEAHPVSGTPIRSRRGPI